MTLNVKQYLQYQKPMAHVLTALSLPMLAGIYNFGWRVAAVCAVAMFTCWAAEYCFSRKQGKPATMASLVTGALLALILPPNVPLWIVAVGCAFCIVFGKMSFGGFGKNMFNPAMVGRCFLYICFPVFIVTSWYAPFSQGGAGGFAQWTATERAKSFDEQPNNIDAVSSATPLRASKNLNRESRSVTAELAALPLEATHIIQGMTAKKSDLETYGILSARKTKATTTLQNIPLQRLFLGNMNGCMGETSALAILLGLLYLILRKVILLPLVFAPMLGLIATTILFKLTGHIVLPLGRVLAINFLAGGALFAFTFMTTEPVSAPRHKKARWIYGALIGCFAVVIRLFSIWPAGLMFSILLGNMFGPLIEILCEKYDIWKQERTTVKAEIQ